ncbi:molybdopterin molybdotransferase MoeA [Thermosipho ferrireducens]|uniref:Molybdopterin molybdenumtransferase n=1 Tax=Thermosipho ferrireducens TaxID=2571116 RepID=A0ABX7S6Z9_9BACT|nr:gephyrin-like molybdotransferase Glp [Thermosipho ferrireducens]QTA38366.1 molybdopterin molybdotransferase MoeA [Thermosipho ferrireducens]
MGKFMNFARREEIYEKYINLFKPEKNFEIPVDSAMGYVSFEKIFVRENLPGFDKSTVDGYALIAEDTSGASREFPKTFKITGKVEMGKGYENVVRSKEAVWVPTGGVIPSGANAVVMVEDTMVEGEFLKVFKQLHPWENVIKKDSGMRKGEVLVNRGERITFGKIDALLANGITKIMVYKKPSVGIISTGSEVVEPDAQKSFFEVRDGNTYTLKAYLKHLGYEVERVAHVKDEYEKFLRIVKEALEKYDVVVTSGGSSVGKKDFTREVFSEVGEVYFHGAWIKPGKPTVFAKVGEKALIGLPGKPVSFMVSAYLFLLPLLKRLEGDTMWKPKVCAYVVSEDSLKAAHGRETFIPVKIFDNFENKILYAKPFPDESGLVKPLLNADGIIRIPLEKEKVEKGEVCEFYMF